MGDPLVTERQDRRFERSGPVVCLELDWIILTGRVTADVNNDLQQPFRLIITLDALIV